MESRNAKFPAIASAEEVKLSVTRRSRLPPSFFGSHTPRFHRDAAFDRAEQLFYPEGLCANVPAYSSTTSSTASAGGILLVEEYGALAVAIVSALQKFAPDYDVQVAHTLIEAEKIASTLRPELFVLDLDPPPKGEIEFFYKMQAAHPGARALVVAAGTSRELNAERGTAAAIQFIEKPFNVAEFGRTVQALLSSAEPSSAKPSAGTLADLELLDVVQLKCLALGTALLQVNTEEGKTGEIHFQHGQVSHAIAESVTGTDALSAILSWPAVRVHEHDASPIAPRTIETPWQKLLLEMARKPTRQRKRVSGKAASSEPGTKKILAIDDTKTLLDFVAETLTAANPSIQLVTASTGKRGLRLATTDKPDLILLDYSLGDMNGDDVCRQLLENEKTAHIPVIMMSGHVAEMARTAETFQNVRAALAKPFLSGALIGEVDKVLAGGLTSKPPPVVLQAEPTLPPEAPAESEAEVSHNGHQHHETPEKNGSSQEKRTEPAEKEEPAVAPAETSPLSLPVAKPKMGTATLIVDVAAVQLDALFRIESLTIQPASDFIVLQLEEAERRPSPAKAFRLARVSLTDDGSFDCMYLAPVLIPPQFPAPGGHFRVSEMHFRSPEQLELTATKSTPMRVQATCQVELQSVELSTALELAALIFRLNDPRIQLHTGETEQGQFTIGGVFLTQAEELMSLSLKHA